MENSMYSNEIKRQNNGNVNIEDSAVYKSFFENINGGGYVCEIDGIDSSFTAVTDGLLRIFGRDEKSFIEMTGNKPVNMVHSPDRKWTLDTIMTQLQVGDRTEVTYRIIDFLGNIKWLHDTATRVKGKDGKSYLISTVTDITESVESNERLKDATYELDTLMTNIPGGICVFEYENGRMKISYANEEFFVLNGFTSEYFYMLGDMDISRFIKEEEYPLFKEALEGSLSDSSSFEFEYQVNRMDGIEVWVSMKAKVFRYHDENPVFYSVIWDTTRRKQIENELFFQSERYKAIEENTDDVPFDYVLNTDTLILSKDIFTHEGIVRKIYNFYRDIDVTDIIHPDQKEMFKELINKARNGKSVGDFEFLGKFREDGEYHWYTMRHATVPDEKGNSVRIVGRVNNCDEEKKAQFELEQRLMHDDMTGLYNKTACEKIVSELLNENKKSAMLVIDIDNFKLINDNFGHTFGDTVIQNFAAGISSAVWDGVIVGRVGGDEFLIFIPDSEESDAEETAQHICTLMKESYVGGQLELPDSVGCSIGISYSSDSNSDFHALFDQADLAMYYSKAEGKNRWTEYNENMLAAAADIMNMRDDTAEMVQTSRNKVYDSDFVTYTFSLLSHSRDIDASINVLLERIGKQFNISFVAVLEDIANDGFMHFTNIWHFEDGIQSLDAIPPLHAKNTRYIAPKAPTSSMYIIDDTLNMKKDKKVGELLHSTYKCNSFAGVRFPESNQVDGCLFFSDCTDVHEWSEFELGTFSELSRVISVFVAVRRERIRSREQIEKLSTRDTLTGLYNQDTFIDLSKEFINEHIKKNEFVALIYTDINGFSYVNENFGYEAGDKMLCDFANAISTDTAHPKINGRVYSDFFLTISASDNREEIINAVESINNYFIAQQKEIYPASNLSLSTGVYFISSIPEHSISSIIENANLARKEAKVVNKSYYVYDDELTRKRASEQTAANELHKAIDTGELRLFLQPKFSLERRCAVGAEALVRWILPDGTMRYPDEFIPILERIGYIVELDYFIFEETLKYIRKWLDEGKVVFPISVNFARQHLQNDDFVKRVFSLTKKYGVPPEYVELEITESESIRDNEHFLSIMEEFHSMGFKIDIDDFGTGYSSLSMLLDAPFDVVKIDRSFITDVDFTPRYLSYLKTLINLIKTSGKDIIFEGVETDQQAFYLLQCGCDNAQGFLFSKAISADEYRQKYVR